MPSGTPNMGTNKVTGTTKSAASGAPGGTQNQGGGKMGAGSSQTGGVKGGTNAAGASRSGPSNASRAASAAAANSRAGANAASKSGPSAASRAASAQAAQSRAAANTGPKSGPGGAGGVRHTSGGTVLSNPSKAVTQSRGAGGLLGSYSGPKGVGALNQAARMASVRSQGLNIPSVGASPAEVDLATRMALAEHSKILNAYGGISTPALQGVIDVARNRMLSSRYTPDTLGGILTQPGQFSPYNVDPKTGQRPIDSMVAGNPTYDANYDSTRSVVESVLRGETAPVAGNSLNYGNIDTIMNPQKVSNPAQRSSAASRAAFGSMPVQASFVSAANPNMQASFGTIGAPSDVNFGAGLQQAVNRPAKSDLENQLASLQAQQPGRASQIPTPREQVGGYLGGIVGNMPQPSSFPGRPMEMAGAFPAQRPTSNFPGRPGEMQGAFPAEDAQPSTFPGRPMEMAGAFPAARQPSSFPARPEVVGPGFPAEDARPSTFPARPAPQPGFESMVAGRPEFVGPGFPARPQSTFPARPEFPGALPAEDASPSTFPGRPEFRGPGFPAAQQVASTFPGRPEFTGPGFPAAQPPQVVGDPSTLTAFGKSIGQGFTGLADAMKQYEENKGKLAIANAFGYNPIGDAVKGTISDAMRSGQSLMPGAPPQQAVAGNYGIAPGAPQPGVYGPSPYMGPSYSFSVPGRPAGTRRDAHLGWGAETALTTGLGLATGVPGAGLATDGLQQLGAMGRQGRLGNNPGGPYTEGADHGHAYEGGSGANERMWTGQEPPEQVAAMQQEVEEVLRGYFVQIPGQQYPQYTTGTA